MNDTFGIGVGLAAGKCVAKLIAAFRRPFVAPRKKDRSAVLRREGVDRPDHADADGGARPRDRVETIVEMDRLGLLAGMDTNRVIAAQEIVGHEKAI